ncbi:MAG: hypothetical protein IKI93_17610, partial [Clostridia bacterium]|nr:hypothetical protein [Clostridia bacterium]
GYVKGFKMKKFITIFTIFLCASLLFVGCDSTTHFGDNTVVPPEKLELKEYTYDEIYCDPRYADDYLSPVLQRLQIYPAEDMAYLYAGSAVSDTNPLWHAIYTKEDGMPSVLHDPFCYDPLCSHNDITCLAYSTKGKTNLVAFEDKVYIIGTGRYRESIFVEYSLSSGKYKIIDTYEAGNSITRMGRFIYFYEQVVTGADQKTGQQESVLAMYRYDLETGKTDFLGHRSGDTHFRTPTPYNGEIYYIYANQLYKCDYNLQYAQRIAGKHKVKMYEIRDDVIWFLTDTGGNKGEFYRMALSGGEAELLYENVTWFAMDGDTLYYSLYDPVDAFEWDIWMETKDGSGKILVTKMITVNNGNMIYRIILDKAGKKGTPESIRETMEENDLYLSEVYTVYNGMLIFDFRSPYSEGTRNGLSSGRVVIDIETSEILRITSESFFPDKQLFPYEEND